MDNEETRDLEIPSIESLREELAREESRYGFRRTLLNIAGVLVVAAAVAALMATRLFVLIRINGSSMEPALHNGEIIFLRQTKEIEVGDMIGFYYGGRVLIKRAIGSEGDYIDIRIAYPTAEDLVILSKVKVESTNTNTVWLKLSESEILMLNNAIVESYIIDGTKFLPEISGS